MESWWLMVQMPFKVKQVEESYRCLFKDSSCHKARHQLCQQFQCSCPVARAVVSYLAQSRYECNLSSPLGHYLKKSLLSQLVWLNETHTFTRTNIRHIMSHFPSVLSKLTFLQPTVLDMSKSLSVCTSIDVVVSIVTHCAALSLFID